MNAQDFCQNFQWVESPEGGRLVTSWRYDDGDQVVIFATRTEAGWKLDDNGESLFRLAAAGVDPESERVKERLAAFPSLLGVRLDDDGESLSANATPATFEQTAMAVAEASAQIQGLSVLRQSRQVSDFRDRVVKIVEEVARTAGIETRSNVPADESQTLFTDVYVCSPTPLLIIAATTPQRLMEAEMIWLDAARRQDRVYVLATVENARSVGFYQYTRANYYTDKTVEFSNPRALADLVSTQIRQH